MNRNTIIYLLLALGLSGCGPGGLAGIGTATPFIITATLPPTAIPTATLTPVPATATATTTPVAGQTKTQVNVRATPSAAGMQLAILPPFAQVQIVGVDPNGKWYEILYPDVPGGTGWVTAEYVYVPQGKDTIPVVGGLPTAASAPSGTPGTPGASASGVVLQQINVRKGPGTQFDALGTLDPQDTVTLIGKSPDGTWLQIQYSAGTGWVAAAFID
ncbi:MAG: SH3 domain-containing protein, partial [Anaerolineae bacterium]